MTRAPGRAAVRRSSGGHRFFIVDVFAEEKYTGNQLAVVLPRGRLSDAEMQRIAFEFNFPETTFILGTRAAGGAYPVRIFTPRREVPFAGHPTLGTAYVIRKVLAPAGAREIVLDLKAGRIPVRFEGGKSGLVWMRQNPPAFGKTHDRKALAGILGLASKDIDAGYPIQEVSTGMAFLMIPLKNLAAVKKARTDMAAYGAYFGRAGGRTPRVTPGLPLFLFSRETYSRDARINCRMFADIFGIPEDPATGSANGCLAGYLVRYGYLGSGKVRIMVEQGYEMDRRSRLHLDADTVGPDIIVNVGGKVFEVAEGVLK
ncbi:MAG TPA: PhzF family phenazine biosynthesis protein [Fibrobacteria bacterium]|nr:PhzF family phenazine biosynthesis protein [Fibrobacteria bacterium]